MASDDLLYRWLAARSVARGVPAPVADAGGWRVDTGSAVEEVRYVFAAPSPTIPALAAGIDRPRVFIKLLGEDAVLAALLPPRWQLAAPSWMMRGGAVAMPAVPEGYRVVSEGDGRRCSVEVVTLAGDLAASGFGASAAGAFVYDRIVTQPAQRRRGLGRVVMGALGAMAPVGADHVLVATAEGRALYEALGWRVVSAYASASIGDVGWIERSSDASRLGR